MLACLVNLVIDGIVLTAQVIDHVANTLGLNDEYKSKHSR